MKSKIKPADTMKNYYIAFSIHGTNTFIVATKSMTDKELAQLETVGYERVNSRRVDAEAVKRDGIKLSWPGLNTLAGAPLKSPAMVIHRFKQLEKAGWLIIGRREFVQRHWKNAAK